MTDNVIRIEFKSAGSAQTVKEVKTLSDSLRGVDTSAKGAAQSANETAKGFQKAGDAAQKLDRDAKQAAGGLKQFDLVLASLKANLIILATQAITQFGNSIVSTAASFEQIKTRLETTLGSKGGAEAIFTRLNKLAAETPLQTEQLIQSFISLQNRGITPTNETLIKLGDLAASQGKSLQQFVEAVLDATSGENERLKEFGINAQAAGDKVTFSFKGINKTVEKTPDAISAALISFGELEGVQGGLNKQAETFNGQISTLQDNLQLAAAGFGDELLPYLTDFVKTLNDGAGGAIELANNLGFLLGKLIELSANNPFRKVENLLPKEIRQFATPIPVLTALAKGVDFAANTIDPNRKKREAEENAKAEAELAAKDKEATDKKIANAKRLKDAQDRAKKEQVAQVEDKQKVDDKFADDRRNAQDKFQEQQQAKQEAFANKLQAADRAYQDDKEKKQEAFAKSQQDKQEAFSKQQQDREEAFREDQRRRDEATQKSFSRASTLADRAGQLAAAKTPQDVAALNKEFGRQDQQQAAISQLNLAGQALSPQDILKIAQQVSGGNLKTEEGIKRTQEAIPLIQEQQKKQQDAADKAAEKARQEQNRQEQKTFQAQLQAEKKAFDLQSRAEDDVYQKSKQAQEKAFRAQLQAEQRTFEDQQQLVERKFREEQRQADIANAKAIQEILASGQPAPPAAAKPTSRAGGGSMAAGKPYLVGDGPGGRLTPYSEIIVPGANSYAIASNQARSFLQGGATVNLSQAEMVSRMDQLISINRSLSGQLLGIAGRPRIEQNYYSGGSSGAGSMAASALRRAGL